MRRGFARVVALGVQRVTLEAAALLAALVVLALLRTHSRDLALFNVCNTQHNPVTLPQMMSFFQRRTGA